MYENIKQAADFRLLHAKLRENRMIGILGKMLFGGKKRYLRSSHKEDYEELAKKFHSTPHRVYELAHGSKKVMYNEFIILEALQEKGIIGKRRK